MIEVLIGNIASGKSTYCLKRAKEGAIIVNDDAIVGLVHGGDYKLYNKSLKPLYKSIENHIVTTAIILNRDVLIDRGLNLTKKSRKRWIGLSHSFDIPCKAVVFKFEQPEIHAQRRQQHDLRGHNYDYWLEVAKKLHEKFENPSPEEGFDEEFYE